MHFAMHCAVPLLGLASLVAATPFAPGNTLGLATQNANSKTVKGGWGGALQLTLPNQTHFTDVYGVFTVPTVTLPAKANLQDEYLLGMWVGMDGWKDDVVWQAGVAASVNATTGKATYTAWHEWFSDPPVYLSTGYPVGPGDSIAVNVTMVNPSHGTLNIENHSKGWHYTLAATNGGSDSLQGSSVEWVVEAASAGVPDYGTVSFAECSYRTSNGEVFGNGIDGADIALMEAPTLASKTEIVSGSAIKVSYVDPSGS